MTWSAPSERARSIFRALHTAVTSASKSFRDLHGVRPYAARRPIDEDLFPGLNLPLVAKTL